MQTVKSGDTVKVHYHGRLTDGTTFDSSEGREPLEFEVGSGMVIKGFDDGVTGMIVGDKKTINIPAEEAYGPRNEEMLVEFPRTNFPPDMEPVVDMQLNMTSGDGQVIPVVVVEVNEIVRRRTVFLKGGSDAASRQFRSASRRFPATSPSRSASDR